MLAELRYALTGFLSCPKPMVRLCLKPLRGLRPPGIPAGCPIPLSCGVVPEASHPGSTPHARPGRVPVAEHRVTCWLHKTPPFLSDDSYLCDIVSQREVSWAGATQVDGVDAAKRIHKDYRRSHANLGSACPSLHEEDRTEMDSGLFVLQPGDMLRLPSVLLVWFGFC